MTGALLQICEACLLSLVARVPHSSHLMDFRPKPGPLCHGLGTSAVTCSVSGHILALPSANVQGKEGPLSFTKSHPSERHWLIGSLETDSLATF